MSDPVVNSSDLRLARELSRRLAGGPALPSPPRAGLATVEYLRFSRIPRPEAPAPAAPPVALAAPPEPAPAPAAPLPPGGRFETWDDLLAWCLGQIGAEAGFTVNTQGFVIASRGRVPAEGFDGMGAELCFALEQLERIDPSAGHLSWVDLEFDRRRIVGFRAFREGVDPMIIGFVAPDPGYVARKLQLGGAIHDNLPNLG